MKYIFRVTTSLKNREFDSCQGNVRDFTKSRGKMLSGKGCLKLLIVTCIFASIQVFSTSMGMIWVTLYMPSAANCQGISDCLEGGHPAFCFAGRELWYCRFCCEADCSYFMLQLHLKKLLCSCACCADIHSSWCYGTKGSLHTVLAFSPSFCSKLLTCMHVWFGRMHRGLIAAFSCD